MRGRVTRRMEGRPTRGAAWGAVGYGLRTGSLALMALGALRQSYRVRRAFAEATPPAPTPLPAPAPSVSVIVPMRNEAANVDGVLTSLLAQDYPAFDVTVIDDGSTNATPQLLAAWARRDAHLRVRRLEALPAE